MAKSLHNGDVMTLQHLSSVCLVSMLGANVALAVSPDELRELSGVTDRQQQQRSNRAKSDDVKNLIPAKNPTPAAVNPPISTKYRAQGRGDAEAQHSTPGENRAPHSNSNYAPPARDASAAKDIILSDSVKATHEFGIRLGQWMEATLDRNSSSAEPGLIELQLTKDVQGNKRVLSAGTLIYALKTLNSGTKRMELMTVKGITPDGLEFAVKGQVFDTQKVSGLNGIMVFDKEQITKNSLTSGALSAVSSIGRSVMATNPAGAALRGATESALTDTDKVTQFNNAQREVIYVSPQPLLIRVDEKF